MPSLLIQVPIYSSLGGKGRQLPHGLRDPLTPCQRTDPYTTESATSAIHLLQVHTQSAHSARAVKHSQDTWPAGQQASHRLRRAAESLGSEPVVPTLWEAKSLIHCCLFSFNIQPSLGSVTHQWSAVTSAQILFGVLLFKKITSLTLKTDLIS